MKFAHTIIIVLLLIIIGYMVLCNPPVEKFYRMYAGETTRPAGGY